MTNNKSRVVIFISGRGSNMEALIKAAEAPDSPYGVVLVLSDKKKAAGLDIAKSHNIPTVVIPRLTKERSKEDYNTLLAETIIPYKPDLVCLAGFMRVVTKEFISHFPGKIINIHPSLLPNFKGLNAQQQAIGAGVSESGCTVHYVNEEVDAGEIIAQAKVPVLPTDTAETLAARILIQEHILYTKVVTALAREEKDSNNN